MIKMVMIPKALMEHENYRKLSDRAKVLYGILSEKKQEAKKNGWVDYQGCSYVIFPKKRMQEELSCSRYRLDLITKELIATDLIELSYAGGRSLERRIYVQDLKDDCPWIRVEYGIRQKGSEKAGEPGKEDETSRIKGTKTDTVSQQGENKPDAGNEYIDPAGLLKMLMGSGAEDQVPEEFPWSVLLEVLVSALRRDSPAGDSPS